MWTVSLSVLKRYVLSWVSPVKPRHRTCALRILLIVVVVPLSLLSPLAQAVDLQSLLNYQAICVGGPCDDFRGGNPPAFGYYSPMFPRLEEAQQRAADDYLAKDGWDIPQVGSPYWRTRCGPATIVNTEFRYLPFPQQWAGHVYFTHTCQAYRPDGLSPPSSPYKYERSLMTRGFCKAGYYAYKDYNTGECGALAVECPIAPLPPITDPEVQRFEANPNTSDIDRLSDRMKRSLSCLQQAIGDAGGTSSVGSAYRPPAYNQHLIDVWKKWRQLMEEKNPACQTLRAEVRTHFKRHKLLESQEPVPNSLHTRGEAFDLTSSLPTATLDSLAHSCGVYRNLPIKDRVHFIHR